MYLSTSRKHATELRDNILDIFQYIKAKDIIKLGRGTCNVTDVPELVTKIGNDLVIKLINIQCGDIGNNTLLPLSHMAIELVLWELMENSKKFHPQKMPALEVSITENAHNICIQVADDGIRLSSDQLTRIWAPYYQAERGFSGQVPGMGLGLSMVSSLIWSAGGTCRAYNREDKDGVVIELSLPPVDVDIDDLSPDDNAIGR